MTAASIRGLLIAVATAVVPLPSYGQDANSTLFGQPSFNGNVVCQPRIMLREFRIGF